MDKRLQIYHAANGEAFDAFDEEPDDFIRWIDHLVAPSYFLRTCIVKLVPDPSTEERFIEKCLVACYA